MSTAVGQWLKIATENLLEAGTISFKALIHDNQAMELKASQCRFFAITAEKVFSIIARLAFRCKPEKQLGSAYIPSVITLEQVGVIR